MEEKMTDEVLAEERKKLIDMEANIKTSLMQLKTVMKYVGEIRVDEGTWELAHYVYSAVENCDKALDKVFMKQRSLVCTSERNWYYDPFTCKFSTVK